MISPQELLRGLNPEQSAAVSYGSGPLLVLAGAGSGKTRVLTRRLAFLVAEGIPQEAIVALTFTNKAAGEMKERVADLIGSHRPRSFVGTFHSYGVRFLRRFAEEAGLTKSFTVFDADDQLSLVKQSIKACGYDDKSLQPRTIQSKISNAKNAGIAIESYPKLYGEFFGTRLAEVHKAYQKGLNASSALDFDDLLLRPVKLLKDRPDVLELMQRSIQHILVDEYQDTNRIQALLVKLLAGERKNVFAVGDEDQSIYRWRGAEVSNILEFSQEFARAQTIKLERNYRSTAPILQAAGAVVAENEKRLGKTLKAERKGGEKVRIVSLDDDRAEAKETVSRITAFRRAEPLGELAVLFRTNAQSRPIEDELVKARIPYLVVGGVRFYERAEVKDALAYLRLMKNPDDDFSFRRVVNVPARGIGATTLEAVTAAAQERGVALFSVLSDLPDGLTERARKALREFQSLVIDLGGIGKDPGSGAGDAVEEMLEKTGLLGLYEKSEDPQDQARRENLDQLLAAAREHEKSARAGSDSEDPSLSAFLDAVTLRSDADDVEEKKGVLLMSVHAAKGLEFDSVFIVGAEDGWMPHASSQDDPDQLEEERRLAYVAMTRAKSHLTISWARRRFIRGEWMSRERSPFLDAIPAGVTSLEDLTAFRTAARRPGHSGGFGESLFPDYENESQESRPLFNRDAYRMPAPRAAVKAPVRAPAKPAAMPVMLRTPAPPSASGFKRGAKVRHPEYGTGIVLSIEGSGDAERLTIHFERAGRKKFLARFANLTPA
jgi:DNA helicase-2/ATP-dependent DNA helicase PcrA